MNTACAANLNYWTAIIGLCAWNIDLRHSSAVALFTFANCTLQTNKKESVLPGGMGWGLQSNMKVTYFDLFGL